jgi:transcriptional regulator with XRE-family HTH domain
MTGRKRLSVPEPRSPTLRRRELGARLRALRQDRGLTVDQVAELLLCSPSKVSRMETGQRNATQRDIRDLCRIYGVTDRSEQELLAKLGAEAKQAGWWQGYELDYFATYVGLEAAAVDLRYYQSSIVPGLLQTVDYAKAMYDRALPSEYSPERANQHIEVRIKRQELLTREPPLHVWAVFDEAVLHRVVGGPAVMAAQMDRLAELAARPNVTIQVLPFTVGAHPAMDNMFNIIDFGDTASSVVYVEGWMGWLYLEKPNEIARYRRVFEQVSALSSNPKESIELIMDVAAKYKRAVRPHLLADGI